MQVGRLDRTQLDTHELLDRIKIMEGRVEAATGQASPFGLTDMRQRVEILEKSLKVVEHECDVNKHSVNKVGWFSMSGLDSWDYMGQY